LQYKLTQKKEKIAYFALLFCTQRRRDVKLVVDKYSRKDAKLDVNLGT